MDPQGGKKLSSKQINGIIWGIAAVVVIIGIVLAVVYTRPGYTDPKQVFDTCAEALKADDCSSVVTKDCYQCEDDPNPDSEGNYRCRCPAEPSSSGVFKCDTANCYGQNCPQELKAVPYYQGCSWVTPGPDMNCTDHYQRGADNGRTPLPDAYCKYNPAQQMCTTDFDRECEPLPPATTYPALEPSLNCDGNVITECSDWTGGGFERESDAAAACNALCIAKGMAPATKCKWSGGSTCHATDEECHVTTQPQCPNSST